MKHLLLFLFLIGSFACGMDTSLVEQDKSKRKETQGHHSAIMPSLAFLCARTLVQDPQAIASLKELQLPEKIDSYIGLQLLRKNPYIIQKLLALIKIPYFYTSRGKANCIHRLAIGSLGNVVIGSCGKEAKIWDLRTGYCLDSLRHSCDVYSVAISPDNNTIVTGSYDQIVRVWDAQTRQILHSLSAHNGLTWSIAISLDNSTIVTGSTDKTARVWDLDTGQCLQTLRGHTDAVTSVAISYDNTTIVTGSHDGTARIWNMRTGECLHVLEGHKAGLFLKGFIYSVAISPDNKIVVTGSKDSTAKIWDLQAGRCLHTLQGHTKEVRSVTISSDNKLILTGSEDNTVRIWDLQKRQCLSILPVYEGFFNSVLALKISSDSNNIVMASYAQAAKICNLHAFNTIYNFLHNKVTKDQALFLYEWFHTIQKNELDYSTGHLNKIYKSFPLEIQEVIATSKPNKSNSMCSFM